VLATQRAACGIALALVCDFRWGYQNTKTDYCSLGTWVTINAPNGEDVHYYLKN